MDTPLIKRAYNLGLKVVPNFIFLSEEQILYYEQNLGKLQEAVQRGFVITPEKEAIIESPLDFIINVNRSLRPSYPEWMKKLIHPELEIAGPSEYNLKDGVDQWLHDDQKNGTVEGNKIYEKLKSDNALTYCLNLQDLLAIKAEGTTFFRKLFVGKAVFGWGSVVEFHNGKVVVPCLVEDSKKVLLVNWRELGQIWSSNNPALRFNK